LSVDNMLERMRNQLTSRRYVLGIVYAILSSACIGFTYLFSKVILSTINTRSFITLWMLVGGIYVTVLGGMKKQIDLPKKKSALLGLLSLGLFEIVGASCFFTAIDLTSKPAVVSFLARFHIIFALFFSVLILKERMELIAVGGAGLMLAGGLYLSYTSGSIGWTLLILTFVMSIAFAGSLIAGKWVTKESNPMMMLISRNFVASLGTFIILPGPFNFPSLHTLGLVAIGAFLGPFCGFLLIYMALDRIDAWLVSILTITQAIFVTIYDWVFLGRTLTLVQILAGILVLFGASIIISSSRNKQPHLPQS
jgi:drug/metabolite transporter (DMT)-like permease